jgi:hypothetical protein
VQIASQSSTASRLSLPPPYDARVALGPVGRVHAVEPHAAGTDMHLEPIPIMLDLVHPKLAVGGFLERAGREGWRKPGGASLERT